MIEKTVVVRRTGLNVPMQEGRDLYLDELLKDISMDTVVPCEVMDSEDILYILYTSGSTGKPKGIQHVQAGYAVGVYATTKFVFDIKPEDIFWCTADVGWVTGHSYTRCSMRLIHSGVFQQSEAVLCRRRRKKHVLPSLSQVFKNVCAPQMHATEKPKKFNLNPLLTLSLMPYDTD